MIAVLDSLRTHSPAALYQPLAAAEVRRLVKQLEFAILSRQWLGCCLLDQMTLSTEIAAWEARRTQTKGQRNGASRPHRVVLNRRDSLLHDRCGLRPGEINFAEQSQ
jgi:hypothetical protein